MTDHRLGPAPPTGTARHSAQLRRRIVAVLMAVSLLPLASIGIGLWLLLAGPLVDESTADVRQAFALTAVIALAGLVLVLIAVWLATRHLTNGLERADRERDALSRDLLRSARLASVGELAAGLAHEINNPLAIMLAEHANIADELSDLGLAATQQKPILNAIDHCQRLINRCSGITTKMLQLGRRSEPALLPTDVAPIIADVAHLLERQAAKRAVELVVEVEPALPRVVLDSTELEQVLVNLLHNSIHAISDKGRIVVRAEKHEDELRLTVTDTGAGIAAEHMDRIFQPFFTTKPPGQGTGLGLSVCYSIVRGWNATIDVASEVGRGTTVSIHLPLAGPGGEPS